MDPKFAELIKNDEKAAQDYFDQVKDAVADKSYFNDALDWYLFRYVRCVSDRTILIFSTILSFTVAVFLIQMLQQAFPLVEKSPIYIRAKDESKYYPNLVYLRPKKDSPQKQNFDPQIVTVDQAVAKYLLKTYVKEREGYDYRAADANKVNTKLTHIRNLSSPNEFKKFQAYMDEGNELSPIHNFGREIIKTVTVGKINIATITPEKGGIAMAIKNFFYSLVPNYADVYFSTSIQTYENRLLIKEEKNNYVAKIKFDFSGVKKSKNNSANEGLNFIVSDYRLYELKK